MTSTPETWTGFDGPRGWSWGAYRISMTDPKACACGWMRGPFAVNSHPRRGPFRVTHLQTHCKIPIDFPSVATARRFAEAIEPLTDWTTIDDLAEAKVRLDEIGRDAIDGAYCRVMRAAGFRVLPILDVIDGGRA